jgi:orotidine-5'-phosphate decarboxylase
MMETARDRLESFQKRPLLTAVTILTSLGAEDIAEVGFQGGAMENVQRLASLAQASGVDGVVCSPLEAAQVRAQAGNEFLIVTPGVRPGSAATDDQKRIMTPVEAVASGADYLVIGRPITAAGDPLQSLRDIRAELTEIRSD